MISHVLLQHSIMKLMTWNLRDIHSRWITISFEWYEEINAIDARGGAKWYHGVAYGEMCWHWSHTHFSHHVDRWYTFFYSYSVAVVRFHYGNVSRTLKLCAVLSNTTLACGVQPKAVIGLKICSWLLFDSVITIRSLSLCSFSIAHQERCGARHRYRIMLVNLLRWKHLTFDDTAICVETKWNEIWK